MACHLLFVHRIASPHLSLAHRSPCSFHCHLHVWLIRLVVVFGLSLTSFSLSSPCSSCRHLVRLAVASFGLSSPRSARLYLVRLAVASFGLPYRHPAELSAHPQSPCRTIGSTPLATISPNRRPILFLSAISPNHRLIHRLPVEPLVASSDQFGVAALCCLISSASPHFSSASPHFSSASPHLNSTSPHLSLVLPHHSSVSPRRVASSQFGASSRLLGYSFIAFERTGWDLTVIGECYMVDSASSHMLISMHRVVSPRLSSVRPPFTAFNSSHLAHHCSPR